MQTCSGDEDGNSSEPVEEEGGNVKAEGFFAFERKYLKQKSSQVPPLNAGHNNATEGDELYNSLEAKRRESSG